MRLKKLEPTNIQGICVLCNKNKQTPKGNNLYRPVCRSCRDASSPERLKREKTRVKFRKKPYLRHRKTFCECCGFIAVNICQLDVDHIDGDHNNNERDNLQTLCANCHRLKTFLNKDWEME